MRSLQNLLELNKTKVILDINTLDVKLFDIKQ